MYLPDYLAMVFSEDEPDEPLPASLELPYKMVVKFKILLQSGRKAKKELGYALRFNNDSHEIGYSQLCTGSSHGINLPYEGNKFAFGNVHCHPALRYKSGNPAHSPEDVGTFERNAWKPVFIAFVASGESYTNYALVSREKDLAFKPNLTRSIGSQTANRLTNYYNAYCPLNAQTRDRMQFDIMSALTPEKLAQAQQRAHQLGQHVPSRITVESNEKKTEMIEELETGLQRLTPGFGNFAESVSIENMKSLVKACGFAFYRSVRGNPRRMVRYQW